MLAPWSIPSLRKLSIRYPAALPYFILTDPTPIDDRTSQICQWVYRNDTEAEAPAEKVIAFDRQVTAEDRDILESTDPDVPLDQTGREMTMPIDKPGVIMRRMLRALIEGEGTLAAAE